MFGRPSGAARCTNASFTLRMHGVRSAKDTAGEKVVGSDGCERLL